MRRIAALALLVFVFTGLEGCGFINTLRAKNLLNEGVRTFNRGKYEDAQKIFEEALSYDPENANAKFFLAMTLNARYEKALNSADVGKPETLDLGNQTLSAFQGVLALNPRPEFQDRAMAFIAKTYKSLADQVYDEKTEADKVAGAEQSYLDYLQKRAELPAQTGTVKSQMYYTIGDYYWRKAHKVILTFEKRDPSNQMAPPTYPDIPADKRTEIMANVAKSHEFMDKAIKEDADYPDPYLGHKLLYLDEMNIAADAAAKDAVKVKKDEWDEKYRDKLSTQQAKQAAAAAEAPAEGQ